MQFRYRISNRISFKCVHTYARKEVEEYSKASEEKNDVSDFDKIILKEARYQVAV